MVQAQQFKIEWADQLSSFLQVLFQLADPLPEGGHLGTLQPRTICSMQYQQQQLWPMRPCSQLKPKLWISIRLQLISANSQSSLHEDEVIGHKWLSEFRKRKVRARVDLIALSHGSERLQCKFAYQKLQQMTGRAIDGAHLDVS